MQNLDGIAVISHWDERRSGFEACRFLRNPKTGVTEAMHNQNTFVRSASVVARVVAGETLIVPVRSKVGDLASIYSFNHTGTLIWKLLESPRTTAELISSVAREYGVEFAVAEPDVIAFVDDLMGVGLVEVPAPVAMAGD